MKISYSLSIMQAAGSAALIMKPVDDQALWARGFKSSPTLGIRDILLDDEWYPSQERRYIDAQSLPGLTKRRSLQEDFPAAFRSPKPPIKRRTALVLRRRGGCFGKQCVEPVRPAPSTSQASSGSRGFTRGVRPPRPTQQELVQEMARRLERMRLPD